MKFPVGVFAKHTRTNSRQGVLLNQSQALFQSIVDGDLAAGSDNDNTTMTATISYQI
jgi:hypothetical protein